MDRLTLGEEGRLWFRCPGCGDRHGVSVKGSGPTWTFNGDMVTPTFKPSLLVRSGHYAASHKAGDGCWCTYNAEQRDAGEPLAPFACYICHSFIRDGQIQFLNDCTHALSGKTVELPSV